MRTETEFRRHQSHHDETSGAETRTRIALHFFRQGVASTRLGVLAVVELAPHVSFERAEDDGSLA